MEDTKMDEQSNNEKQEIGAKIHECKADLGRSYAPEFIDILAKQSYEILLEWMKKNHLPEEVIDLLDNIILLNNDLDEIKQGGLSDWSAAGLAEEIPHIIECISQLGGTFSYLDYESDPR
jgi:hypothetical protein